jgi:hypothetical protein
MSEQLVDSIKADSESKVPELATTRRVEATRDESEIDVTEHALFPQTTSELNAIMDIVAELAAEQQVKPKKVESLPPLLDDGSVNFEQLLEEEATAAGGGDGGGGEGNSFVMLKRIVELTDPLSYEFPSNPTGRPPTIEGSAAPLANAATEPPVDPEDPKDPEEPGGPTVVVTKEYRIEVTTDVKTETLVGNEYETGRNTTTSVTTENKDGGVLTTTTVTTVITYNKETNTLTTTTTTTTTYVRDVTTTTAADGTVTVVTGDWTVFDVKTDVNTDSTVTNTPREETITDVDTDFVKDPQVLPTVTVDLEVDPGAELLEGRYTDADRIVVTVTGTDGSSREFEAVLNEDGTWTVDLEGVEFAEDVLYTATAEAINKDGTTTAIDTDSYDIIEPPPPVEKGRWQIDETMANGDEYSTFTINEGESDNFNVSLGGAGAAKLSLGESETIKLAVVGGVAKLGEDFTLSVTGSTGVLAEIIEQGEDYIIVKMTALVDGVNLTGLGFKVTLETLTDDAEEALEHVKFEIQDPSYGEIRLDKDDIGYNIVDTTEPEQPPPPVDPEEPKDPNGNNGHGNNTDGQDDNNPGQGDGGPNSDPKDGDDEDEGDRGNQGDDTPGVGTNDEEEDDDSGDTDGDSGDSDSDDSDSDSDDSDSDSPDKSVGGPKGNNGWGNGDQDAPGNSLDNNNAENSDATNPLDKDKPNKDSPSNPDTSTGGQNPGNDKEVGNSPWDGETGASGKPGQGQTQDGIDVDPNQPGGNEKGQNLSYDDLLTDGDNSYTSNSQGSDISALLDYSMPNPLKHLGNTPTTE